MLNDDAVRLTGSRAQAMSRHITARFGVAVCLPNVGPGSIARFAVPGSCTTLQRGFNSAVLVNISELQDVPTVVVSRAIPLTSMSDPQTLAISKYVTNTSCNVRYTQLQLTFTVH